MARPAHSGNGVKHARFEKIDARFEKIDARFEKIDARFEKQPHSLFSTKQKMKTQTPPLLLKGGAGVGPVNEKRFFLFYLQLVRIGGVLLRLSAVWAAL
jgi:hypothetical protein